MATTEPSGTIPLPPPYGPSRAVKAPALTPALVVVDSRNIYHQTESATGFRELPCVDGVVDAMKDFGFDALEVHIGLALPRSQDAKRLAAAGQMNRAFKKKIEEASRGRVLLGELHAKQRDGGRYVGEEKQVDVACAVDICRHATLIAQHDSPFKAIVVLSQDTDLTPALRYAEEIHVPAVVAAHERVERRGFPYILLTERSFRKIARVHEPLVGHALRSAAAMAAFGPEMWCDWEVIGWDPTRERVLLVNADGLRGVIKRQLLDEKGASKPGAMISLRVTGLNYGPRRNSFPLVACTTKGVHPSFDHRQDLVVRTVAARRAVGEVELATPVYSKSKLDYPLGGVVPGCEVVIDCREPNRPILVGPLSLPVDRAVVQAAPIIVEPFKRASSTTTAASCASGRVLLAHSSAESPAIGRRYAAVVIDEKSRVGKLISGPLP